MFNTFTEQTPDIPESPQSEQTLHTLEQTWMQPQMSVREPPHDVPQQQPGYQPFNHVPQ